MLSVVSSIVALGLESRLSLDLMLPLPLQLSSSPPYRFTFLFSSVSCFMIPPHKLTKSCRRHAIAIFSTTTCCLRLRESLSKLVNRIKLLSHACSKYPASFSPYRFSFLFSSVSCYLLLELPSNSFQ